MFFWVLLGFTGFYRVLLGFTGFYLVFIVFYRVLLATGLFRYEPWKMISLYRRRIAFVFFVFFGWIIKRHSTLRRRFQRAIKENKKTR